MLVGSLVGIFESKNVGTYDGVVDGTLLVGILLGEREGSLDGVLVRR